MIYWTKDGSISEAFLLANFQQLEIEEACILNLSVWQCFPNSPIYNMDIEATK